MQPLEMSAKTGRAIKGNNLEQMRDECRRRYRAATRDFTPAEADQIIRAISRLHPYLNRHFSKLAGMEWKLIKLDSHVEGGMPRAFGPYVTLPSALLEAAAAESGRGWSEKLTVLLTSLLHEQIHVAQNQFPDLFTALYSEVWGFRRVEIATGHPWLIRHRLTTPETLSATWIYPVRTGDTVTWIWPTLVLGESRGIRRLLGVPSLRGDMRMVAVELVQADGGFLLRLDSKGFPVVHRLVSFQEYRREFPLAAAPYHPNEIAAESFTRLVSMAMTVTAPDGQLRPRRPSDAKTSALQRWFSQNLN
jgi:hypothetical protein